MAQVSEVWRVVQAWLDTQRFPPNQSKIAEHLGVQRSAVSDWKSGKTRPTPEHVRAMARMMESGLGPDVHDLLVRAIIRDMGYDNWPEPAARQLQLSSLQPDGTTYFYRSADAEERALAAAGEDADDLDIEEEQHLHHET